MIIVADTTPILYLIKIREVDVLELLFDEVCIPREVYNELTNDEKYIDEINILNNTAFIKVYDVNDRDKVSDYMKIIGIHKGEAEAIALCKQLGSELILIEDGAGIRLAQTEKIGVVRMGTLLLGLNKSGYKTKEEIIVILEKLKDTKIRISQDIYDFIIKQLI